MTKTLSSLIEDIERFVLNPQITPTDADKLGKALGKVICGRMLKESGEFSLRLSSIGRPKRRLWYDSKNPTENTITAADKLKFLYGDIIEELLVWLVEKAGHTVANRQDTVVVEGIVGHTDGTIDGQLVDYKSASGNAYKKFSQGTLKYEDPFGYYTQLASYNTKYNSDTPSFLAFNKENGSICLHSPDPIFDLPDPVMVIQDVKECLQQLEPPEELCYPLEVEKNGNESANFFCSYCPHIDKCFKHARKFKYARGVKYYTKIVNKLRVEEIK